MQLPRRRRDVQIITLVSLRTNSYTCAVKTKARLYTIIVGDLVGSRRSSSRQALSQRIHLTVDHLAQEYKEELHAPLVLTKGIDEISGVLKRVTMGYRICRLLNEGIYPAQFRFAIVRGPIDIGVNSKDAARMDGAAFHMAADLIRRAKKESLFYSFRLGLHSPELDGLLTELANVLHTLRSEWSAHQREVVQHYEKYDNQAAVAKQLGITQQAVSDALRQANWKQVDRAEKLIDGVLERSVLNK